MEKLKNKYVQWIGAIIFALSGAVLSLQLILDTSYTTEKIIITTLVSFICCILIWRRTNKEIFGNRDGRRIIII